MLIAFTTYVNSIFCCLALLLCCGHKFKRFFTSKITQFHWTLSISIQRYRYFNESTFQNKSGKAEFLDILRLCSAGVQNLVLYKVSYQTSFCILTYVFIFNLWQYDQFEGIWLCRHRRSQFMLSLTICPFLACCEVNFDMRSIFAECSTRNKIFYNFEFVNLDVSFALYHWHKKCDQHLWLHAELGTKYFGNLSVRQIKDRIYFFQNQRVVIKPWNIVAAISQLAYFFMRNHLCMNRIIYSL